MKVPPIPQDLAQHLVALHRAALDRGEAAPSLSLHETHALAREYGVPVAVVERAALEVHLAPERYRRNLGTVGWEGQRKLLEATVAVVGAGGLGGWIIEGLARMGVGHLIVVDGDRFTENNLNRQLGCTEETLGLSKVEVLAQRLAEVNAATQVTPHALWLTEENAVEILDEAQVLVDALDSLPARYLLQRVARALGLPMVHGAIAGYTGQVMTIFPGDPGLESLYGETPPTERGVERMLGNPTATPMMISAWQIHEVVKLITGQGRPLRHRLLIFDAEHGEVTELSLAP
ncbi:MAG: HesA/MoeB/ThiF family protein [Chloroflexi bacterium]|nr:HesA/MoeB/ThiF family protein [Chloroflexota bacterium]